MLRAYEHILADPELPEPAYGQLIRHLQWDGYTLDATGRLHSPPSAALDELPLAGVDDPAAIYEHIDRIGRVMDADPAQAISGARALIGATTKLVLNQLGVAYDEQADVPTLVKAAQKALGLHPETLAPTGKGSETVRRVLSNLSQVAVGVAELRNEYGPDHGRTRVSVLSPRHAHLPVGCAGTYGRLLLETLADPTLHGGVPPRIVPREDVRFHGYLSTECPIGQVGWTVASGDVGDDRGAAGTGAERWLRDASTQRRRG